MLQQRLLLGVVTAQPAARGAEVQIKGKEVLTVGLCRREPESAIHNRVRWEHNARELIRKTILNKIIDEAQRCFRVRAPVSAFWWMRPEAYSPCPAPLLSPRSATLFGWM